jgi:hypothetical protein
MYLQREFTSIITIPENSANIPKEELEEFERHYDCTILRENQLYTKRLKESGL